MSFLCKMFGHKVKEIRERKVINLFSILPEEHPIPVNVHFETIGYECKCCGAKADFINKEIAFRENKML